ncbi:MAG: YmdB family metallophosphoesterase, partial [Ignavibacteriaceae bacterium]|nr:YmdB family metallophosphoesterase [Ignavibacteriaceae bacterium]
RTFMSPLDCPFRTADWVIQKIKSESKIVILDFHAEATAEKMAMGHYLDSKISALIGTHTHIQTADERILAGGTAYITDVGMSGPYDSVIGMKTVAAINRFIYQTPQKYETATDNVHLAGVFLVIDSESGTSKQIERIIFPEFERNI